MFFKKQATERVGEVNEYTILKIITKYRLKNEILSKIYVATEVFEKLTKKEFDGVKIFPDNGSDDPTVVHISR